MYISIFEIFKIGIGPSSSHTVGPMKAAREFVEQLKSQNILPHITEIQIALYGSLALTGRGHGTDKALLMGLCGEQPDTIDPDTIPEKLQNIRDSGYLNLLGSHRISFFEAIHLLYYRQEVLPKHTNGLRFTAFSGKDSIAYAQTYYSIGGGFIVTEAQFDQAAALQPVPYPFSTAEELLSLCRQHNLSISQLMLANEAVFRPEAQIHQALLDIANTMSACIHKGCSTEGILPGGLEVRRRAAALYKKLLARGKPGSHHPDAMNWLNVYAMAVNEENAAGGRIVTAPTNGAAGIVPAVLQYYREFCPQQNGEQGIIDFLLTAGAIAILYKLRASISGAEVGCQGEVGVACSMAAGALAAVLNGTLAQVENAAEIGMEHNLGLPCDPPKGLVQIPCIERNAMGAVKAINAAFLALAEDGQHKVSLDNVIQTMQQIGKDMMTIYKETSLGGLAVNVPEC
ncbi:MAG TPA: L-serine ammonia-lyase [Gammaproteobacteria bacterium]|nr:L-serine ammonia-lyase [Gammaproteobacteria bacterium]